MCGIKQPKVLELGCGDGRDARDILEYTPDYLGTDYAQAFIDIARRTNPDHADDFCVADMRTFFDGNDQNYDIVFAFASILHLNRNELASLIRSIVGALSLHGLVVFMTKYADQYTEDLQHDRFGDRWFYYYHPSEVIGLAGDGMVERHRKVVTIGRTVWFEQILQKE